MSQHPQSVKHNKVFSKKRLAPLVFFLVFPPIGIAILIYDLLTETRAFFYTSTLNASLPIGTRTVMLHISSSDLPKAPLTFLKQKRKNLLIWGVLLSVLFGFSTFSAFLGDPQTMSDILFLVSDIISTLGGVVLLCTALRLNQKIRYFSRYANTIGNSRTFSISALSSATGLSAQQVRCDLEEMLKEGCFPSGIFDCGGDTLISP